MKNIFLILSYITLLNSYSFASNVGFIKQVTGVVKIKRLDKTISAKKNDKIQDSDIIITKNRSSICIVLNSGKLVTLDEKSILPIKKHLTIKKSDKHLAMNM